MKKNLFFAAAAIAVAFSSCSSNEVQLTNSTTAVADAISFGTYTGAYTKASMINFADGDAFGVFAYYTATDNYDQSATSNFMYDQTVSMEEGVWGYTPLKYWPNNVTSSNEYGKVTFFAYYPQATEDNGLSIEDADITGDPIVTYDQSKGANVDLMWGVCANGITEPVTITAGMPYTNMIKTDDAIKFTFMHALARAKFTVVLGNDITDTSITTSTSTVTSVTINSIEFAGTINPIDDTFEGVLMDKGQLNLNNTTASTPNWTAASDAAAYAVVLEAGDFTDGTNDANIFSFEGTGTDETTFSSTLYSIGDATADDDDYYVMFIPATGFSSPKVRITYTVTTTDSALYAGESAITNISVFEVDATTLAAGSTTNYTFTINLGSVDMKAEIDEDAWDTATEVAYTVPTDDGEADAAE